MSLEAPSKFRTVHRNFDRSPLSLPNYFSPLDLWSFLIPSYAILLIRPHNCDRTWRWGDKRDTTQTYTNERMQKWGLMKPQLKIATIHRLAWTISGVAFRSEGDRLLDRGFFFSLFLSPSPFFSIASLSLFPFRFPEH